MIKKYLIIALGSFVLLPGCKKPTGVTGPLDKTVAYVSFTNVNASAKTVNVFVDNTQLNNAAAVAPNGTVTGTYLGVYPGDHLLEVKENSTAATFFHSNNITVAAGNAYSYFVYDTLKTGRFKGILLTSDRKINPASPTSKVRFLNLSPKAPALDLWLIRRVGAVVKDSLKIFSAVPSLTSVTAPDATALSAYTDVASSLAAGAAGPGTLVTDYIIRVKLAGTNIIILSPPPPPAPAITLTSPTINLVNGRTYTFFTRGIFGTSSFGVTTFFNN